MILLAVADQAGVAGVVSAPGAGIAAVQLVPAGHGKRIVRCGYYSYGFALYHRFDGVTIYSIVVMGTAEETALTDDAAIIRYLDGLKAEAERYCADEALAGRVRGRMADAAQRIDLVGASGSGVSAFLAPESGSWTWAVSGGR
jgi:hypothetical protein